MAFPNIERMLTIAVVAIIIAIAIPQYTDYRDRKQEEETLVNTRLNYENLAKFVQSKLDAETLCPWTGEPYPIIRENGMEILAWPGPDGMYPTNPRFIKSDGKVFFEQDYPSYNIKVGKSIPFSTSSRLTNEAEYISLKIKSKNTEIRIPKTGGVFEYTAPDKKVVYKNIIAALPVSDGKQIVFTILQVRNRKVLVSTIGYFKQTDNSPLALIHKALFPKDVALLNTRAPAN